jgi:hypothetical protein
MHRRNFLSVSAAATLAGAAPAAPLKNAWFSLLHFYLRQGTQVSRTTAYLKNVWMPAAERAELGPLGFFSAVFGERSPYILSMLSFPSLASMEAAHNRLADDKEFWKGWEEYQSIQDPPYVRLENELLYAFDSVPQLVVPPTDTKHPARIFELRTYESLTELSLQRKIKMFNDGEAGIFRRLGMNPVFFGQSVFGRNQPKLTYMLAYDDMAARDKLWRDFSADPEWQKLRAQPGLSDAELVSNISNPILRPLPFSAIR